MTKGAPVRMVWKALSTFEASSADVSMKDRPFSAVKNAPESECNHMGIWIEGSLENALASSVGTASGASNRSCCQRA